MWWPYGPIGHPRWPYSVQDQIFELVVLAALAAGAIWIGWNIYEEHTSGPDLIDSTPRVINGNTLIVDGRRVRLFGIDAPEADQSCNRLDGTVWACGARATEALKAILAEQRAQGGLLACYVYGEDLYGRAVASCGIGDLPFLGDEMVRRGWAVAYMTADQYLLSLEAEASRAARGIWAGEFVRPEDWRHGRQ